MSATMVEGRRAEVLALTKPSVSICQRFVRVLCMPKPQDPSHWRSKKSEQGQQQFRSRVNAAVE